ncbi:MAG: ribosomal subunit interface protein, partial [Gemmatimonadales bacterium]
MQIQVNTDNNIDGQVPLLESVRDMVAHTLERFEDRLTRVEVHL